MCDMIPDSEHWRLTLAEGRALQQEIMGYLPGFATPRMANGLVGAINPAP